MLPNVAASARCLRTSSTCFSGRGPPIAGKIVALWGENAGMVTRGPLIPGPARARAQVRQKARGVERSLRRARRSLLSQYYAEQERRRMAQQHALLVGTLPGNT